MVEIFGGFDLLVRGEEVRGECVEAPGVTLDGESQRTALTKRRYWRGHSALRHLLCRGRASRAMAEIILGHCAFCGLVRRSTPSCFHS
eukprot:2095123-Pyramimonas_sp.AAC.1